MFKYLLSLFSIFVLLLPSVFIPARTLACPVKLPETLLSLYRNSDVIYVARFDKAEDGEIIEDDDERTIIQIKNHFDISSTLKGETRKFFVYEQNQYRSKSAEQRAPDESEEIEESDEESPFGTRALRPGDLVLLFLKHGEDGSTLELTDYSDAIKRMTPRRLESYEARIRELNSIFGAKKVDDTAILDWIIRCTQDPETRWEGAYQLQRSYQQLAWFKQQENEEKDEAAEDAETAGENEIVEESETAEAPVQGTGEQEVALRSEADDAEEPDDSVYARLLSDAQKETLMSIVLERRPASAEDKDDLMSSADRVLIDVVSNWGGQRFAKFLLDRLQSFGGEPYEVSELMSTVAKVLSDETLQGIAEKYSNVYYEDDDELVDLEEAEDATEKNDGSGEVIQLESENSNEQANEAEPDAAKLPRLTYKQLRAQLFNNFIDRGLVLMAVAESEKQNEKASR